MMLGQVSQDMLELDDGERGDGGLQHGHFTDLNIILKVQLDILSQVDIPQHGVPCVPRGGRLIGEGW